MATTGRFAVLYTGQAGDDAAWVFETQADAEALGFGGEGWFDLWEAEDETPFELDTKSGALWAPARRRLVRYWSYFEEEDWEEEEEDWEEDWEN